MKKLLNAIGVLALAGCLMGKGLAQTAFPNLPEVVMLSTGRVFKKAVVKKCGPELVTLAGAGWTQSVRYDVLPDDVRSALEPFRPGGPQWFAGDTSGNTVEIDGQIFAPSFTDGAFKFGNTEVYIFDLNLLTKFSGDTKQVNLPRPLHKTTTDADGKFKLRVPKSRPYFIFAQAIRITNTPDSFSIMGYEWRVPMSAVRKGEQLKLASEYRYPLSRVVIEEQL